MRYSQFDVIRFVAMFSVVMCHCADLFNFIPDPAPANADEIRSLGAMWGSMLRPCVPLFAMLTGALLLPVKQEMRSFYRKRIGRVFWPFLLWSVVYALFPWLLGLAGGTGEDLIRVFPYAGEQAASLQLAASLQFISAIPLTFSPVAVHMWYIYLLIGLYLFMPILSAWIEKATEREKLYFLLIWGITLFVPYYRALVEPYFWGGCSWNEFTMLYYFAGFNGYLVLGHYLRSHLPSLRTSLLVAVPAFVLGYFVTLMGFTHMRDLPGGCTDEQLELFFYYCSPNVVLMTIAVYLVCSHIRPSGGRITKLLENLTKCGFGIYMVHYFFAGPAVLLVRSLGVPLVAQLPAGAVVAMGISWLIVFVMLKMGGKTGRYLVG